MKISSSWFILIIPLMVSTSYVSAQTTQISISTNKEFYSIGDTILISGMITSPGQANTAVLQVYSPLNELVQIGTITFGTDGSYTTSVKAKGEAWNNAGTYTIKVKYFSSPDNAVATKTVSLVSQQSATTLTQPSPTQPSPTQPNPSTNQSQQVPFWVKDTARKWHDGTIDNESFSKVIQYMIASGLVQTNYSITPMDTFVHIPYWVKNTAQWWTQGVIPDKTFFNLIQYLLDEKIIRK